MKYAIVFAALGFLIFPGCGQPVPQAKVPGAPPPASKAAASPVPKAETVKATSGPFKGTVIFVDSGEVQASPLSKSIQAPAGGLQTTRWLTAKVNARDRMRLDKEVARYERTKETYTKLEQMRSNGVPAVVIYAFHMRESDCSMARHLHEGSLLKARTVDVPKGRPPPPAKPPFTFLQSGEDALYTYEKLERRNWHNLETALQAAESYNGLGYQKKGRVSPYMWAGTSLYTGGKYIKDGVFSATAYDQQLGICAVFIRMKERGIQLQFE